MIDNTSVQWKSECLRFSIYARLLRPVIFVSFLAAILLAILSFSPLAAVQVSLAAAPTSAVGGCPVFPTNNIRNYDISHLPVEPNSANYIASMGLNGRLNGYFGTPWHGRPAPGIPYTTVTAAQPPVPTQFYYANQSDPGPYPVPANAPVEGGLHSDSDRHVLIVNTTTCKLYEMWRAFPQQGGSWSAGSGAVWDLRSNALRPLDWTSADAAGLPIFPGLVRYDEVTSGIIAHALRVTSTNSQCKYLWPARHYSSSNCNPNLPPLGLRLRLKASVNISSFPPDVRVILTALKHYGMFVADNGPKSWVLSGAPNSHWNNKDMAQLGKITGSDFEAVDESMLQYAPDSGQVNPAYMHSSNVHQASGHQNAALSDQSSAPLAADVRRSYPANGQIVPLSFAR